MGEKLIGKAISTVKIFLNLAAALNNFRNQSQLTFRKVPGLSTVEKNQEIMLNSSVSANNKN